MDGITRAQSGTWALKFKGEKCVLWEKAIIVDNYSGVVLDGAEIISPLRITLWFTVNKNIHLVRRS